MKKEPLHIETIAVHAGLAPDPATGDVIPAIHTSTTYERDRDGKYSRGYSYTREANPTRDALQCAVAELESGAAALVFSSGSAATTAVLHCLKPGAHVVAPRDCYYGTRAVLAEPFGRWGLQTSFVEMSNLDAVRAAVRPETALVWVETPGNPMMTVTDIAAVAAVARQAGALCVCDNTLATPVLQRPLELGADAVTYATTKYVSGHGDVLGGALVMRENGPLIARLRPLLRETGPVPSPFDSWLVLRGIRTLPYRVRAQSHNALQVAEFLAQHAQVERALYPGLATHPGHDIARRQMAAFGGVLSFLVKGDAQRALEVAAKCRLFTRATSFGGPESLIEHRLSVEGPGSQTPPNLLRLSIGLEHHDDLIADLDQALR